MATTRTRRCIGSARFGIEPHEAKVSEFPKQPSQPDGLGRMCAVHWKAYVTGLTAERKAKARDAAPEASAEPEEEPAPTAPAHEHTLAASLVGEGQPFDAGEGAAA
jgi:hypothetical protein